MKKRGFTLIELMVAIVILTILSTAGVNIFYRSIKGTSQLELRKALDDRARLILSIVGRFVREGRVMSLDGISKETCVQSGSQTGSSLVIKALDNIETTISIANGQMSSASANGTIVINPDPTFTLITSDETPYFTWYCSSGVSDRVLFSFRANSISESGETTASKDYLTDMILRNTGQ